MGRFSQKVDNALTSPAKQTPDEVQGEIERMDNRPDHIDAATWELIQQNGQLATERLNEILRSPKFTRLRASDQAKLIALAQNRAYGMPQTHRTDPNKNRGGFADVTAEALRDKAARAMLPEYRNVPIEDAEVVKDYNND